MKWWHWTHFGDTWGDTTAFMPSPQEPRWQQQQCSSAAVQQVLGWWGTGLAPLWAQGCDTRTLPPLAEHLQQDTTGTGSACMLQIKTIQMQAPGITSWRILSNRLCFHALFIHIYISVKMGSFELIDAFLWVFVRNQHCTSPGLCYICGFVSSQVPNTCKFSYLRQINSK